MKILKARIKNYKSHLDSGDIELQAGMNVIVGKNDAGKSALIEALSLAFIDKPHRSLKTAPLPTSQIRPYSDVEMLFELSPADSATYLAQYSSLVIPLQPHLHATASTVVNDVFSRPLKLQCVWRSGNPASADISEKLFLDGVANIEIRNLGSPTNLNFGAGAVTGSALGVAVALRDELRKRIYGFRAERMSRVMIGAGGASTLTTDASNLAEVLNTLSTGNPFRYAVLMGHLSAIFPELKWITTEISSNVVNAKAWGILTSTQRQDLAIPLNDSGTGISQVLAILYVVVTSNDSQVICIDEPQSFLHPGAFRKLFDILRAYPQHQYVVTTHSPSALLNTDRIFIARRESQETKVVPVSAATQETSRDFLLEVGARLSDVFGADSVLWVEGKTEEHCFPIILREVACKALAGVQILSLIHTGDLNKKDASRILGIYKSLSAGPTLMPQALAFVLDDEGRSEQEKRELNNQAGGLMRWLPRRLYENYLIDSTAIAELINTGDPEAACTEESVSEWLKLNGRKKKFWKSLEPVAAYPSQEWSRCVHAAELLSELFTSLTDARLVYDKVRHGVRLTEILAARKTEDMQELATFLVGILESDQK